MKLFFISDRIVFHISYAHTPNVTVYKDLCGFSLDTVDLRNLHFPLLEAYGKVISLNPEIADEISFPPDDEHLLQFHQGHFHKIHHVKLPFDNIREDSYQGYHPERTVQSFHFAILIHYQDACRTDDLEEFQDV